MNRLALEKRKLRNTKNVAKMQFKHNEAEQLANEYEIVSSLSMLDLRKIPQKTIQETSCIRVC